MKKKIEIEKKNKFEKKEKLKEKIPKEASSKTIL